LNALTQASEEVDTDPNHPSEVALRSKFDQEVEQSVSLSRRRSSFFSKKTTKKSEETQNVEIAKAEVGEELVNGRNW
jgi:hypothetical protein